MRVSGGRPGASRSGVVRFSPHYPFKQLFDRGSRSGMLEVKDGRLRCEISDVDFVENQVFPKQFFDLPRELRLAVDLEPFLLAQDDAVGEELPLRCEEGGRAAGARRELLDVVRDEAVEERRAILAVQDDRAAAGEVEEEGRRSHGGDSRI